MAGTSNPRKVAYFSIKVALDSALPTHSGGLGIPVGSPPSEEEPAAAPPEPVLLYR